VDPRIDGAALFFPFSFFFLLSFFSLFFCDFNVAIGRTGGLAISSTCPSPSPAATRADFHFFAENEDRTVFFVSCRERGESYYYRS